MDGFDKHVKLAMHREAVLKINSLCLPNVATQLSSQVRRQMLMVTFASLRFLLRQGLAVRGHNDLESNLLQLLLLQTETIPGLKPYIDD